jgi:hypothetical protein
MSRLRLGVATIVLFVVTLFTTAPAFAHEHRTIGGYTFVTGWLTEPTFSGGQNAVQLFLSDGTKQPVTDLGGTLNVEVIFGGQKTAPLPMKPAFGATYGTPGEYHAALLPTRPGVYTFHFLGTIHGQPVDESFTSSDHTFNSVSDATGIEFPAKDPSTGELATKVDRLDPRIEAVKLNAGSAHDTASTATTVGVIGIIVGAIGLLVGGIGLRVALRGRRPIGKPPAGSVSSGDGTLVGSRT